MSAHVVLHWAEREARGGWLPVVAYPDTVLVGPTGEQLVVQADGALAPWPPDGRRSIASDPTATRRDPESR